MIDPQLLAAHRAWQSRDDIDTNPIPPWIPPCDKCGCVGNKECGHEPLGAPAHHCELDINSDGERGWCWCCRIEEE